MQHPTGDDRSQPGYEGIVEANPADVADQHLAVDPALAPDAPDPDELASLPLEAEPADVAEQRLEVPMPDEDEG
jgi:hypothetical protein